MDSTVLVEVAVGALAVGGVAVGIASSRRSKVNATSNSAPVAAQVSTQQVVDKDDVVSVADSRATVVETSVTHVAEVAPELQESPESVTARSTRLRDRFGKSQSSIADAFRNVFSGGVDNDGAWDELEDTLIMADLGARAATEVVDSLKVATRKAGAGADVKHVVREHLVALVDGGFSRELATNRHENRPAVVLTVGVNGTGKTTTTGKLARLLVAQDKDVLLGAADTFRAAAANQLETWGERVGSPVVRGPEGGDPASVAFDAVNTGIEQEVDVVLIDTAGRLHTKQGLMDELGKVHRVAVKAGGVDEILLVIDATTGQNGLTQARVFSEVVPVTGIVLTKLDGTAKGGIVVAVQQELGVPVKLVGLGEGPDDLAIFDPVAFVEGLIN
jgi:fused signal recognition particle receptor